MGRYLSLKKNWDGEIIWNEYGGKDSLNLLVNKNTNLIFPALSVSKDIWPLAKEYSYHVNPYKRFAQTLYVLLSISKAFRNLLASQFLSIHPCPESFSNICILPGNHSIRIINLDLNECLVLSKLGYRSDKLANAVLLRTSFSELPGPKIIDWDLSDGWYTEERIFGLPLNRLSNKDTQAKAMDEVRLFLNAMYDDTSELLPASKWFEAKFIQLDMAIEMLPVCYSYSIKKKIIDLKLHLTSLAENYTDPNYLLENANTHGDLQAANLLAPSDHSENNVYIIDWEYTGNRIRHYDAFVYNLDARSPHGLAQRINKLLHNETAMASIIAWCGSKTTVQHDTSLFVLTFIVDEFLFRLDDTTIPNLSEPSKGFLSFIDEAMRVNIFSRNYGS